jgi:hypothetical protein
MKDKRNWLKEKAKQAEEAERKGVIKELYKNYKKVVSEKV